MTVGLAFDAPVPRTDEQNDLPLGGLDLLKHGLQALFELAAELGAGDERAHCRGGRVI